MMRAREKLSWALVAVLGVAVIAAFARVVEGGSVDPPRPPGPTQANLIYQPADCGGFPISITQSGSYALAENITMPGGCAKDGIQINTGNVTLDLRGFTVQGAPAALTGVVAGNSALTLINGKVTEWPGGGVDVAGAADSLLSGLQVVLNGPTASGGQLVLGHRSRLSDCVVNWSNGAALGIVVTGTYSVVEDCTVSFNNAQGLKVVGAANRISRNQLSGNSTSFGCADLWVVGTGNVIERNTAVFGGGDECPYYLDAGADDTVMYGNVAQSGGNGGVTNYTDFSSTYDVGPLSSAIGAGTWWANLSE